MDTLDSLLGWFNKLEGMSAFGLTLLSCWAMGYVWRAIPWKWFPNEATPVAVMAWGCLFMSLINDGKPTAMPPHVWFWRNIGYGLIVGVIAWVLHDRALSHLEDFLSAKFGTPAPGSPTATPPINPPKP